MSTASRDPLPDKRTPFIFALTLLGMGLLVAIYFAPIKVKELVAVFVMLNTLQGVIDRDALVFAIEGSRSLP